MAQLLCYILTIKCSRVNVSFLSISRMPLGYNRVRIWCSQEIVRASLLAASFKHSVDESVTVLLISKVDIFSLTLLVPLFLQYP